MCLPEAFPIPYPFKTAQTVNHNTHKLVWGVILHPAGTDPVRGLKF